ncbi:hypothetical protein FA13DRAFT_1908065 [Coprinellus micaceus]|uniref:Uncharacterized protein n=1 Tax=Coprinellus micaceus TaxID=71717 RepID=A0A4Y7SS25_COPMI|nr:hypothetical protein FA13DRAFT_1908065 [Coprinellus micaceus]
MTGQKNVASGGWQHTHGNTSNTPTYGDDMPVPMGRLSPNPCEGRPRKIGGKNFRKLLTSSHNVQNTSCDAEYALQQIFMIGPDSELDSAVSGHRHQPGHLSSCKAPSSRIYLNEFNYSSAMDTHSDGAPTAAQCPPLEVWSSSPKRLSAIAPVIGDLFRRDFSKVRDNSARGVLVHGQRRST